MGTNGVVRLDFKHANILTVDSYGTRQSHSSSSFSKGHKRETGTEHCGMRSDEPIFYWSHIFTNAQVRVHQTLTLERREMLHLAHKLEFPDPTC